MTLREITYLLAARTTTADCVPLFWTRSREQAMSKRHNVKSGYANDIAARLGLPAGELIDVCIIELVNGSPARVGRFTPRSLTVESAGGMR